MLVMSRKAGEQIVIGNSIVVVVNRIVGNRVSFGVDAPAEIPVSRRDATDLDRNRNTRINNRGKATRSPSSYDPKRRDDDADEAPVIRTTGAIQ